MDCVKDDVTKEWKEGNILCRPHTKWDKGGEMIPLPACTYLLNILTNDWIDISRLNLSTFIIILVTSKKVYIFTSERMIESLWSHHPKYPIFYVKYFHAFPRWECYALLILWESDRYYWNKNYQIFSGRKVNFRKRSKVGSYFLWTIKNPCILNVQCE